jgi:hypothetical protein
MDEMFEALRNVSSNLFKDQFHKALYAPNDKFIQKLDLFQCSKGSSTRLITMQLLSRILRPIVEVQSYSKVMVLSNSIHGSGLGNPSPPPVVQDYCIVCGQSDPQRIPT